MEKCLITGSVIGGEIWGKEAACRCGKCIAYNPLGRSRGPISRRKLLDFVSGTNYTTVGALKKSILKKIESGELDI
jgi:hypothetical protein